MTWGSYDERVDYGHGLHGLHGLWNQEAELCTESWEKPSTLFCWLLDFISCRSWIWNNGCRILWIVSLDHSFDDPKRWRHWNGGGWKGNHHMLLLTFRYLKVHESLRSQIHPTDLSICLSIHLSIYPSIYRSIYIYIYIYK